MGTFLPFEIITYATCIWKISCTDSRLSRMPKATAGTSRMVQWTRRKLCTTQYTPNTSAILCLLWHTYWSSVERSHIFGAGHSRTLRHDWHGYPSRQWYALSQD